MNKDNVCCIGIVDDDKDIITTYKLLFERRGITVCLSASDGVEAIHMFSKSERKPNVIIMDERMNTMSGSDAAKALIHDYPKLSVIIISADGDARIKAFSAGAKIFLRKPVSTKVIIEAVRLARKNCTSDCYYYDDHKGFIANTTC